MAMLAMSHTLPYPSACCILYRSSVLLSHDIVCSKVFTSSSIQYVELCFSAGMLCCHVDDFIVSMMAFPYSVSVINYAYTYTYMHNMFCLCMFWSHDIHGAGGCE